MVSIDISSFGRIELIFIDPDVKKFLLPVHATITSTSFPRHSFNISFFTFQHYNAPAHRTYKTVAVLSAKTPDFIGPLMTTKQPGSQLRDLGQFALLSDQ